MKRVCVFGGTSLYRLPIYNQMAKELSCDFYISADDPKMGIIAYDTKKLLNLKGQLGQETRVFGNFTWVRGMISSFFKPYDVYLIGGPYGLPGWILIFLSKFSRKEIASWSHGIYGRETGLRKFIKVLFYKLCDQNFVYNERAKKLMIACGISRDKIVSVGNSQDTDEELRIRKELKRADIYHEIFHNDNPVLIFVGRVIEDKRLHQVIEGMEMLKKKGVKVNFFVIGKDVDGVNLLDIAKKHGVSDQLYLYGPCYDNRVVANFFYNADVCVSPGAIGLTATNAMTYGCPVITHDDFNYQGPEYEAVIPDKTGDFFKANDVADLSEKIKKWTSLDEEAREEVRKDCFAEVDRFWNIYSETEAFRKSFN